MIQLNNFRYVWMSHIPMLEYTYPRIIIKKSLKLYGFQKKKKIVEEVGAKSFIQPRP